MSKQHCVFHWLVLLAIAFAVGVNAQVSTSTITGVVTDTSGSVIPGAHVRVTDESTGLARETNSNQAGIFVVPQLALGKYRVEVEATGFKKAILEHVECNLEQVLSLNFRLEVGQLSESLTVTAAPPMIATDTTSLGNLRYLQQMQYLPENARGLTQLLGYSAGIVKDVSDNTAQTPFAGHVFMAASAPDNTAWVFDGTWGNTPLGGNGNIVPLDGRLFEQNTPNLESIAEFKVSTANNKAESQMAYTVSVATKSGTNELHGSAFEYNRVGAESARSFFSPTREALTRNQYGGSLGGPVYFPHLYNGHNRTFFFASYEGFRDYRTVATTGTLPNTQEVAGDLSAILNKIALRDPLGGVFPNNIIPASRITAVSKGLLKYVPAPIGNQSASTPIPFNFVSDKPVIDRDWKYDVKLDHRFSDKDSVSGRFTDSSGFQDNLNTSPLPGQFGQGYQYTWGQQLSAIENHIFSPTSLNELRLGYYRKRRFQSYGLNDVNFLTGDQAIPGINPQAPFQGPPSVVLNSSILGVSSTLLQAGGVNGVQRRVVEYTSQIADDFTLIRGRHQWKFGGELRRMGVNWLQASGPDGTFTFTSSPNVANSATGDSFADFLLGLPLTAAWAPVKENYSRAWQYGFFAQDDFKVSPRLTINYGLRWDYLGKYVEKYGRDANFDLNLQKVVVPPAGVPFFLPQFVNNPLIVESTSVGLGDGLIYPQWNDWGPRIGIAYQPFGGGRFVIRAAYGIFYGEPSAFLNGQAGLGPPYNLSYSFSRVSAIGAGGRPPSFSDPTATGGASSNLLASVTTLDPHQRDLSTQIWNFTLEDQLGGDYLLRASYIGNKGTNEQFNPYRNACIPGTVPCAARTAAQSPALAPLFPTSAGGFATIGNSHYEAMELEIEHRLSRGLFFNANYTLGKTLAHDANVEDPLRNLSLDFGPIANSIRHMFHFNSIVDLPFGPNQRWLKNTHGVTAGVVSGWKLSGDLYVRSGTNFTVTAPTAQSGTGSSVERANCSGPPSLPGDRSKNEWLNEYFNTSAFAMPALGTIGTCGVGILSGPGLWSADTSVNRIFALTERLKLQFRADFFNVFNHPNFANPDSVITDSAFGRIAATTGFPRQMQFGLHLRW